MADRQYDISPKMQELFKKKQEQRAAAKEFWRKQLYNPYSQKIPFDPVLFRHGALSAYSIEYFKNYHPGRTLSNILYYSPFFILGYILHHYRSNKEAKLRSGTVSYEERTNKLFY